MWMTLLSGVLKRPWIIALVVMGIAMGGMWVNIQRLESNIIGLKADMVVMKSDFQTCENNEHTLMGALDSCNFEISGFISSVELMSEQVKTEKGRVVYWRDKYNNKTCYKPSDEVVVIKKDEVRVLNDEKNVDAVNTINSVFGN